MAFKTPISGPVGIYIENFIAWCGVDYIGTGVFEDTVR